MLLEQIAEDYKIAFKEKNQLVVEALRNLKSEIKNAEIAAQKELAEDDVLKVVMKKVKQHKDSIDSFAAGGRSDLVEHEKAQMEVLQKYMPQQMDESAVRDLIKATIAGMNATAADFGKVMKEVSAKTKGQADGKLVSQIVKEELK